MAAPYVFASGAWRQTKAGYVFASGAWRPIKTAWVFSQGAWRPMSWAHDVIIRVERWEDRNTRQSFYGFQPAGGFGAILAGQAWPGVGNITSLIVARNEDGSGTSIILGTTGSERQVTATFSLDGGFGARSFTFNTNVWRVCPSTIVDLFELANQQSDARLFVKLN